MSKGSGGTHGSTWRDKSDGTLSKQRVIDKINSLQPAQNGMFSNAVINPIPYAGKEIMSKTFLNQDRWYDNKIGTVSIEISKLETIQPYVQRGNLIKKLNQEISLTKDIPVVEIDGRYILQDGNHTVSIAKLSGKKKIEVTMYKYK